MRKLKRKLSRPEPVSTPEPEKPKRRPGNVYQNMGGHMIAPPETCKWARIDPESQLTWVDLGICTLDYCKVKKTCPRYAEYNSMNRDEIEDELRDYGVWI